MGELEIFEWSNGSVLYYWLNHNIFGVNDTLKPIVQAVIFNKYGCFFTTWLVLSIEFFMSIALYFSWNIRKYALGVGLFFHFLIFIFLGLGTFFISIAGCLVMYLFPVANIFNLNHNKWNIVKLKK
jgi:hypothetical protein